jgi:hypothetical protein
VKVGSTVAVVRARWGGEAGEVVPAGVGGRAVEVGSKYGGSRRGAVVATNYEDDASQSKVGPCMLSFQE